ncbi:hypothetical protein ACQCWA_18055 [Rossellomorea aquimaris]|uniref:hypothetical protein n=1 Tax=Rossellomorea aquimaris TaxID=189382 RepID=UPI003CF85BA8
MSNRIDIYRSGSSAKITRGYDLSVTLVGYGESNRYLKASGRYAEYSASATLTMVITFSLAILLKAEISSDGKTLTIRAKS